MTTTEFPWDQFNSTGDFPDRFKFEQPGQQLVGTITNIRVTDFGSGKPEDRTPELWISQDGDAGEVSVTASQARLRSALAEQRPQIGDRIAIVFTGYGEAKPPKSAPKLFDVKVVRGNGAEASASASTPASQPAAAPATVPASAPSAADLI